jgi:hypothetical protein
MAEVSQKQVNASQAQVQVSQKQLYDQRRPVLYPTDGLHGQLVDKQGNVAWMAQDPALMVRNTGAGVALNVVSELEMGNSTFPDTDTIAWHPLYAPAKPKTVQLRKNAMR